MKTLILALLFTSISAFAESPALKINYVGGVIVTPCKYEQAAIADWYSRFGIKTIYMKEAGEYFGKINTTSGPVAFGIHPRVQKPHCGSNLSVVFQIDDLDGTLKNLKAEKILPFAMDPDQGFGRFAHFHDPEGNEVSLWAK